MIVSNIENSDHGIALGGQKLLINNIGTCFIIISAVIRKDGPPDKLLDSDLGLQGGFLNCLWRLPSDVFRRVLYLDRIVVAEDSFERPMSHIDTTMGTRHVRDVADK